MRTVEPFFGGDKKVEVDEYGFIEKDGIKIPYYLDKFRDKKKYETEHDIPCPSFYGESVANNPEINEWVLNRLPLKEEEKEMILISMKKDYTVDKNLEKRKIVREKVKSEKKEARKKEKSTGHRESVKNS